MTQAQSTDQTADHLDPIRETLLKGALEHVPFDGWSSTTLRKAARENEIEQGLAELAFPQVRDLVVYFIDTVDAAMLDTLAQQDIESMRIRDRITNAIWARIEALTPVREAERRAVAFMAMPQNSATSARCVLNSVDLMWRAVGDRSTDFNFYSKRATLAGVLTSTIIYWLGDSSDDFEDTRAFLDRRIEDVMRVERAKGQIRKATEGMPSIARALSRLRYGADSRMKP